MNRTDLPKASQSGQGVLAALGAFLLWGLLPFYWKALQEVPYLEVLSHRILWSLLTLFLLLFLQKRGGALWTSLKNRRQLITLGMCSFLIAVNWSLYIWSVQTGQLVEASLGYYINPLMNVFLGIVVLKERLGRVQIVAVTLAAAGILLLTANYGRIPWIALGLAVSFALYGLLKKRIQVDAVTGLCVETLWLSPAALAYIGYLVYSEASSLSPTLPVTSLLLVGSGAVTAAPLLLFAMGAKRLRLSTIGFLQYISPTCQLLLAVLVFSEPFTRLHLVSFGLIWTALVLYSFANWQAARARKPVLPPISAGGSPV